MKRFSDYLTMCTLAIVCVMLTGCDSKREKTKTVVASFAPQEWMLRQIAGDSLRIVTLLPPGSDAENYQPSTSTLKDMADADVWFTLGTEGFESSLQKIANSNFPDVEIAECTDGIDKIYGTHEGEDSFDPHILTSVRNSVIVAQNMTDKLCALYPEMEDYLKGRSEVLINHFGYIDKRISRLNITGSKFAIRHPSLSYFARDYGLIQLPLEIEGKESTPKQMMQRMEEIKRQNPAIFVIDGKHSSDRDREMADELGMMPTVVMLDGMEWTDYLEKIAMHIKYEADRAE